MNTKKIFELSKLQDLHTLARNQRIVVVGGCFDLIHFGHIEFLKRAKQVGDYLVVLLEPDRFIHDKKDREPVHTQDKRAEMLAAMEMVDAILMLPYFEEYSDYQELLNELKPAVIAITEGDPKEKLKHKQAKELGATLQVVCPNMATYSTSEVLKKYATFFGN